MTPPEPGSEETPVRSFRDLGEFHDAEPDRVTSAERDHGLNWQLPGDHRRWRISAIEATGEVIAARLDDGPIEILATDLDEALLDAVLSHLPERWSLPQARTALRRLADLDADALAAFRADVDAHRAAGELRDRAIRRESFACLDPAQLPEPDVDAPTDMLRADWPAIGRAAAAVLRAGIDPLDRHAVEEALAARLDERARPWAETLFRDPIAITGLGPGASFINGRHRSRCLRDTASTAMIAYSVQAEAAAERRHPAPTPPVVPWL